jgi:hypothetical protein
VAGAVGHEGLEVAVGVDAAGAQRRVLAPPARSLLEGVADRVDDLEVGALAAAAEVVLLAGPPALERRQHPAAVVLDVEPVAHVAAVAVDRQRRPSRAFRIISGISFSGNW